MLAINVARRALPHGPAIAVYLCALPLAVGAAAFSYRFFESPIARFGRRLVAARPGSATFVGMAPLRPAGRPPAA
jgi:peptidoglycan/LPS O-acetylase OafA/YrhL